LKTQQDASPENQPYVGYLVVLSELLRSIWDRKLSAYSYEQEQKAARVALCKKFN